MTHPSPDPARSNFRRHLLTAARALGALALFAVLIHVSWNMFAPDLFGLPAMRIKQALGLVLFAATLAFLARGAVARRSDRHAAA